MKPIKDISYIEISKNFNHKKIHFTSDCEFFPHFDVKVYIYDISLGNNNEIIFQTKLLNSNKLLTIGSNMKNLQYEYI